jgi:hypothetical protein
MGNTNWDLIRKITTTGTDARYRRDLIIADPKWKIQPFKNKPMKEIPQHYLRWVIRKFDSNNPHRIKAQKEMEFRKKQKITT